MKVSMWVINLEGRHFEVSNTAKSVIDIGNSNTSKKYGFLNFGGCNEFDLILYDVTPKAFVETTLKIIHKCSNELEAKFLMKYIVDKVHEKSDLMQEIQALKKIKSAEIQPIIDDIKSNVRNNYFEFKIADILNEINVR